MNKAAIQNFYPDGIAVCYGCGRNNPHGLHIKTYWNGTEGICRFNPRSYYIAFPGIIYGGLIANLIDCHSIGTAIAAAYDADGREPGTQPSIMYVTGNLNVSYLHPTPADVELVLRSRIKEMHKRKTIITCSLYAEGKECARGEVVAVRAPTHLE